MGRIFWISEDRFFFVLFYTGMAIFNCDVCAKERLISTKYKMKAKMAKRKKKHWVVFHFRVWGQEMYVELTRKNN